MKCRLDFVTNSSSSSFVCYGLFNDELYDFLNEVLKRPDIENKCGNFFEQVDLYELEGYKCVYLSVQRFYDNGNPTRIISSGLNGLKTEDLKKIKSMVKETMDKGLYLRHSWWDQTDGFAGYVFRKIPPELYSKLNNIEHHDLYFKGSDPETLYIDGEVLRSQSGCLILPTGYKKFKLCYLGEPYDDYCGRIGEINGITDIIIQDDFEELDPNLHCMCNCAYIELNDNIHVIPDQCFMNMEKLEELESTESIEVINDEAFKDCKALRNLELLGDVSYISESSFDGCDNLTITCHKNSYVHNYAIKHNIKTTLK